MPYRDPNEIEKMKKIFTNVTLTVDDISRFNPSDLKKEDIYQKIYLSARDPEYLAEIGEAVNFAEVLETILEKDPNFELEDPDLFNKYQDIILLLRFNTIPVRSSEEVNLLIKNHLLFAFQWEVDVKERIILLFSFNNSLNNWMNFRNGILNAMRDNQEELGRVNIRVGEESSEGPPTIGNWVKDYEQSVKTDKPRSNIEESSYISQTSNVRQLNEEEKNWLLTILNIYDMMMFSGVPGGAVTLGIPVPEAGAQMAEKTAIQPPSKTIDLSKRQTERPVSPPPAFLKTPPKNPPSPAPVLKTSPKDEKTAARDLKSIKNKLLKVYQGNPEQEKAIHLAEENILKQVGDKIDKVNDVLFESLNTRDRIKALASLRILASESNLVVVLGADQRYRSLALAPLQAKYGREAVADFDNNPITPAYFSLFLQSIFKEQLGLTDIQAVSEGLRQANILAETEGPHYLDMVYGDLATGEYKWTPLETEGGRLVLPSLSK